MRSLATKLGSMIALEARALRLAILVARTGDDISDEFADCDDPYFLNLTDNLKEYYRLNACDYYWRQSLHSNGLHQAQSPHDRRATSNDAG